MWGVLLLVSAACSDDSGGNSPASGGAAGTGATTAACSAFCAASVCGQVEGGCDCGLCTYDVETIADSGEHPVMAAGERPAVAYLNTARELLFAERTSSGWTSRKVMSDISFDPSLALALRGAQPWISLSDAKGTIVAHDEGGTFVVDTLGEDDSFSAPNAAITIASDGRPLVAYSTKDSLITARHDSGGWVRTTVASAPAVAVDLATVDGTTHLAWVDTKGQILYASRQGDGPFTPPEAVGNPSSDNHVGGIVSVNAAGGKVHIGLGRDDVILWTRDTTGWRSLRFGDGGTGSASTAITPDGTVHVLSTGKYGILADIVGDRLSTQTILPGSGRGGDLAADAQGGLHLAVEYGGGDLLYLRRAGLAPPTVRAACVSLVAQVCDRARECLGGGQKLCHFSDEGTSCLGLGNVSICESKFHDQFCSDVTKDPGLVDACAADMASATCEEDDERRGVRLPDSCSALLD